ncbi:MAG: peptide deformylase [bacterium]
MSILKIFTNPNPVLRQTATALDPKVMAQAELQTLIHDMAQTMAEADGAGLAAPQIGQSLRLIAVAVPEGVLIMANPQITKASWLKEWGEEGCLSVPNIYGEVKRHKKIRCKFYDAQGQLKKIEAEGMLARVIQHEIDHLNGILFIDKAKNIIEQPDVKNN